ncbi:putative Aaa ATPase domain protein [Gregarina niphandrodes]|uniref:Aaa ATPase domain protein n=1 Tax=Gregarina niphandrodes TaxID=110365 RepID=A0A023B567_GRENI|nr:putative Aaa ATPase domain protein [Gregarina niphandrodes]EZG58882.1 putative Aaa ATPase domain protein [Gregarina niphandrodes]|eukprot:XP_011130937.1 putative Aaa ATPase domain protein [Gregarina niphandrodes]
MDLTDSEVNILILGPTGVGKSTWINAFINYLTYNSLDDALKHHLRCEVPFAFRAHYVNEQGEFNRIQVSVELEELGQEKCHSATGDSSTQRAFVYQVNIQGCIIRLIDTPGIGDTRGADQDKKNMDDIMKVLGLQARLHGILILLKPNEQRLDYVCRFRIKELLSHLHRDAAKNIAFGFTNTRGTNYSPGDTLPALCELLDDVKVDIKLGKNNVFCFDSESFRYLAAKKKCGVLLGQLNENRSSWEHSVRESNRLLEHFRNIQPYEVRSTVNLHDIRRRIECMANIVIPIGDKIRTTEHEITTDLSQHGTETENEKFPHRMIEVKKFQLVCNHQDCIVKYPGGIIDLNGHMIWGHGKVCDSECGCGYWTLNMVASTRTCSAFGWTGKTSKHPRGWICKTCKHPTGDHRHVDYKLKATKMDLTAREIFMKQKQVAREGKEMLVKDLASELTKLLEVAAEFSMFLKANALITYNDIMVENLDRLVEDEQAGVGRGDNQDKLNCSLSQYRDQYKKCLCPDKEKNGDEPLMLDNQRVMSLMDDLYSLEHYGTRIKESCRKIDEAEQPVNRQKWVVVEWFSKAFEKWRR